MPTIWVAEIAELCNSAQVGILVIPKIKLNATKKPSKFLPKNYETSARRDKNSLGGGILIATKKGVMADDVPLKASASGEIICRGIACT